MSYTDELKKLRENNVNYYRKIKSRADSISDPEIADALIVGAICNITDISSEFGASYGNKMGRKAIKTEITRTVRDSIYANLDESSLLQGIARNGYSEVEDYKKMSRNIINERRKNPNKNESFKIIPINKKRNIG